MYFESGTYCLCNIFVICVLWCSWRGGYILNIEFPVGVILMQQAGRISQNSPHQRQEGRIETWPIPCPAYIVWLKFLVTPTVMEDAKHLLYQLSCPGLEIGNQLRGNRELAHNSLWEGDIVKIVTIRSKCNSLHGLPLLPTYSGPDFIQSNYKIHARLFIYNLQAHWSRVQTYIHISRKERGHKHPEKRY